MKNNVFTSRRLIAFIAFILLGTGVFAQQRFGMRNDSAFHYGVDRYTRNQLNLTDEQQEKLTALREANQKEMTDIRNDLAIKRAELQKLQSADNINLDEVNKKLDEIGQLTTEMAKKSYALEQEIQNLLTDEQKAAYRSNPRRIPYGFTNRGFNNGPGWRGFQGQPFMAPGRRMNQGRRR